MQANDAQVRKNFVKELLQDLKNKGNYSLIYPKILCDPDDPEHCIISPYTGQPLVIEKSILEQAKAQALKQKNKLKSTLQRGTLNLSSMDLLEVTIPDSQRIESQLDTVADPKKEFTDQQAQVEQYNVYLKVAQNYDMEKHQRKLRKMEEKRNAEEEAVRKAFSPSKRKPLKQSSKMQVFDFELHPKMKAGLCLHHPEELTRLKDWLYSMSLADFLKDEHLDQLFGIDLAKIRSDLKINITVSDFFSNASSILKCHLQSNQTHLPPGKKLVDPQSSPFIVNQQYRKLKKENVKNLKVGKQPLYIKILNQNHQQSQLIPNMSPTAIRIQNRAENKIESIETQTFQPLDLSFIEAKFFQQKYQQQKFVPDQEEDEEQITLEDARSPYKDDNMSSVGSQSSGSRSPSFGNAVDVPQRTMGNTTFQRTSQLSIQLVKDDALLRQLQSNKAVNQLFGHLRK